MKTNLKIILVFAILLFAAFTFVSCSKDEEISKIPIQPVPTGLKTSDLIGKWYWYGTKDRNFTETTLEEQNHLNYWTRYTYYITANSDIITKVTHRKHPDSTEWSEENLYLIDTLENCFISGDTLYSRPVHPTLGKLQQFQCVKRR